MSTLAMYCEGQSSQPAKERIESDRFIPKPVRATQFIFRSCIISAQNIVSSLLLPHLDAYKLLNPYFF